MYETQMSVTVSPVDQSLKTGRANAVDPVRLGIGPAHDARGGGRCSPLRRPVSAGVRFVQAGAGSARKEGARFAGGDGCDLPRSRCRPALVTASTDRQRV